MNKEIIEMEKKKSVKLKSNVDDMYSVTEEA